MLSGLWMAHTISPFFGSEKFEICRTRIVSWTEDIGRLRGIGHHPSERQIEEGGDRTARARVHRRLGQDKDLLPLVAGIEDVRGEVERLPVLPEPREVGKRECSGSAGADGLNGDVEDAVRSGRIVAQTHGDLVGARRVLRRIELDYDDDVGVVDPVVECARVRGVCRSKKVVRLLG
jgi:hypothetical protein